MAKELYQHSWRILFNRALPYMLFMNILRPYVSNYAWQTSAISICCFLLTVQAYPANFNNLSQAHDTSANAKKNHWPKANIFETNYAFAFSGTFDLFGNMIEAGYLRMVGNYFYTGISAESHRFSRYLEEGPGSGYYEQNCKSVLIRTLITPFSSRFRARLFAEFGGFVRRWEHFLAFGMPTSDGQSPPEGSGYVAPRRSVEIGYSFGLNLMISFGRALGVTTGVRVQNDTAGNVVSNASLGIAVGF